MFRNYLLIALRNLWKSKGITSINVLGLSLGLACFSLILLYVVNELNYDRFHAKSDNIYRIYRTIRGLEGVEDSDDAYLPMPLGPAFQADFSDDVANFARLRMPWQESFVRTNDLTAQIPFHFTDPAFFDMFSFNIVSGNRKNPLQARDAIVLSESTAKQLFGDKNPIGEIVDVQIEGAFNPFTVTAVMENMPPNSSFQMDMLGNYERLYTTEFGSSSMDNWGRSAFQTFVELKPNSTLANETERIYSFRKKYYPDDEAELQERGLWNGEGIPVTYGMQPLRNIHTEPEVAGIDVQPINPRYAWILLGIGGIILLVACINFTTLSIGRSAGRTREIGVRKIVGAKREQLMLQFLTESFLLTIFSLGIGLGISKLLLPVFNDIAGRQLVWDFSLYPELYAMFLGLVIFVTLLAGAYPSLVLSGFRPINILRHKLRLKGANWFTNSLVSFQFVLSIGLIACTVIMLNQLQFLRSKNPGFNKENVLVINGEGIDAERIFSIMEQEIGSRNDIVSIATSDLSLGANSGWSRTGFEYDGRNRQVYEYFIDPDYIPTLGMELIAGRNFDYQYTSDSLTSVIVNEAMVSDFGWTNETAVGQELTGYALEGEPEPTVIGVVKNFNFRSLHQEVAPQMLHMFNYYEPSQMFVRLAPGDPSDAIEALESSWQGLVEDFPLRYAFLDENLNQFYESEARWGNIVGIAGGLSVLLACLGLLGLTSLVMVNRTKEIGIRKVLGASVTNIIALLSKDFLRLVLIAAVIAIPIAWWAMSKWLEDFAYRIELSWWMFLLGAAAGLLIAVLTVSVQAGRSAASNPVDALRNE